MMYLRWCLAAVMLLVVAQTSQAFVAPTRKLGLVGAPGAAQRPQYRGHTAVEMNLGGRFLRVAKANLNSLISRWEDPEKVLDQTVEEMNRDLVKVRQSYAEVSATQKRLEKQREQAGALAEEWYKRAQLALSKGDEELAREALTRRQQQVDTEEALAGQIEGQAESVARLYDAMGALEARINEAKATKDQLVARARTAKTANKVNDMLGAVGDGSNSMSAFDRMAEKVDALEAEAEITGELAGTSGGSLEQKFKALEGGNKVDDELAKLKGTLGGSADPKALPGVEDELEKMKRQAGEQ